MLGLAEIRLLKGNWQTAIEEMQSVAEMQAARASAEPQAKLLVLGKLADLCRRFDLSLAVWPLEVMLDVLLDEVKLALAPSDLMESCGRLASRDSARFVR